MANPTKNSVLESIKEYDEIGLDAFAKKYGTGTRSYYDIVYNEKTLFVLMKSMCFIIKKLCFFTTRIVLNTCLFTIKNMFLTTTNMLFIIKTVFYIKKCVL